MIILGIDPGLTNLGWGIISISPPRIVRVASGTIRTKPGEAIHKRLAHIQNALSEIVTTYKPAHVALEETFVNNNAATSLKLGYVRGAIMALIGQSDIPLHEFAPNAIKKSLAGCGHASKEQVSYMVQKVISSSEYIIKSPDEADALAVAYTCSVYL